MGSRSDSTSNRSFALRFLLLGAVSLSAIQADPARATTILVGQTIDLVSNTTYPAAPPLILDGGRLRIGDPFSGPALTVTATDAVLGRGMIDHWYSQVGLTSIQFYGTTTVPGAASGAFPADGMYLRADAFDTPGADFVNQGTFVQSGTGELTLLGSARFVGALFSTYYFDNDLGMQGIPVSGVAEPELVNDGSSFIKRGGSGTSHLDLRIVQNVGKFELWTGSFSLNAGGRYQSAYFFADAFGTNTTGAIHFGGGSHVFQGYTRTETGRFRIDPGATVQAGATTPENGGAGEWFQRAALEVGGTLDIDGSIVTNTGSIETTGTGVITGRTANNLVGTLNNSGRFTGHIRASFAPPSTTEVIEINNDGEFTITASQVVEVGRFINFDSGLLHVDGTLSTFNDDLLLRGGVLSGSGVINGNVFLGGGPSTARFTPGSSPGTMAIDGAFVQEADGELVLEIGGIAPGEFDVVDASDGASFEGGTIRFERVAGYFGDVGAELDFFAGGLVSIDPSVAIIDNTGFELDFDPSTGIATITVPEPDLGPALLAGLLGVASLARRSVRRIRFA